MFGKGINRPISPVAFVSGGETKESMFNTFIKTKREDSRNQKETCNIGPNWMNATWENYWGWHGSSLSEKKDCQNQSRDH